MLDLQRAAAEIDGLFDAYRRNGGIDLSDSPDFDWFDPRETTTKEVAYRAIVPMTKRAKSSLSTIMSGSMKCFTKCIVSHTWANIFSHTVAACVADAMEEPCYFQIAPRLQTFDGVRGLMRELGPGRLVRTYWICAISINQHTVACHTSPWEPCDCDVPKITTGEEAEIGAFDEMMKVLKTCNDDFYQVIAMDKGATVTDRVWVVAEIAQGHQENLDQRVKSHFPLSLSKRSTRDKLLCIDVNSCQATVPEDKTTILNKIIDKADYNRRVLEVLSRNPGSCSFEFAGLRSTAEALELVLNTINKTTKCVTVCVIGVLLATMYAEAASKLRFTFRWLLPLACLYWLHWGSTYSFVCAYVERAVSLGLYEETLSELREHLFTLELRADRGYLLCLRFNLFCRRFPITRLCSIHPGGWIRVAMCVFCVLFANLWVVISSWLFMAFVLNGKTILDVHRARVRRAKTP